MKNYLFILALVFAFSACNKNNSPKPDGIIGTWELREHSSGWITPKTYEPGNGNKFIFTSNGTYTKYAGGKLDTRGSYVLTPTREDQGVKYGKISLTNPDYADVYNIRKDTLNIGTSIADGPSWQYVRIK